MRYFYFLLSTLTFAVLSANAQSNFKPGYILNAKNDTLRGYVDYREWGKNPKQILFKTALNQNAQKITVGDAAGFGVDNFEYYNKAVVPVSTSTVNISRLSFGIDTASVIDTVFLKVRVKGSKVVLYELTTDEKALFYLGDRSAGTITPLNQYLFLGEDNHTIVNSNRYIGQLITFANTYSADDKKLHDMILRTGYNVNDLKRIVLKLNGDANVAQAVIDNSGIRYFVSAGVASRKLSFSGSNAPFSEGKSTSATSPMLSAGIDFLVNKRTEKTVFRLEVGAVTASYNIAESRLLNIVTENTQDRSLQFKQVTIFFVPQVIYNFYSSESLKVFADLGVELNFSKYNDQKYRSIDKMGNVVDDRGYDFESFQISFPLKAGVQVGKNLQIYGGYMLPTSITRYVSWSTNLSAIMGGVTYLF